MASQDEATGSVVADIPLSPRFGRVWILALAASGSLVLVLVFSLGGLAFIGLGLWGTNVPFVWGFDLVNYAWWISLANGASLFAAILVLRGHSLRTSINRFAEGLALFAVICAAIFPVIHLGRPWLFYWVFPYPATFQVWPQFRSPLMWDLWAIFTHVIVTTLLWYVGLLPDLATLRDRTQRPLAKRIYGVFALGWRGSARHWAHHQSSFRFVAIAVLPILLVTQSTVAFEFASTLVPDWHDTRLPLHFVVTGLASGLGMVLFAAAALRAGLGIEEYITDYDMQLISGLVLASALVVGYLYVGEIFLALLSEGSERVATINRFVGTYAVTYWGAIALLVLLPQALWFRRVRLSAWGGVTVGLGIAVGLWLDRFSIVVAGLQREYLPAMWRTYTPTLSEWLLLVGSAGLFAMLFLLFARYLPVVSIFEMRHDEQKEQGS